MSAADLTLATLLHKNSNAVFSKDGKRRYWLHRRGLGGIGWAVFVMLNPSKAGVDENDSTVRTCIGFAKRWAMEGMAVVNLHSLIATDPIDLERAVASGYDTVGPENLNYVSLARELADECHIDQPRGKRYPGKLICAWGAHRAAIPQVQTMLGWLEDGVTGEVEPQCLGITKSGMPRHPLYTPFSTPLQPYDYVGGI